MPIYSYKCESCGRTFDKLEKVGGNGSVKCIYCNAVTHRLFSPVGIIFKGSGFYSTDYRSGSGQVNTAAGKSEQDGKGKTGESKTKSEVKDKKKSSSDNVKAEK